MTRTTPASRLVVRPYLHYLASLSLAAALLLLAACVSRPLTTEGDPLPPVADASPQTPDPDPRVGLRGGLFDAEQAIWNLNHVSATPPPAAFIGSWNTDLAFTGNYVIQGNYNGIQIWDISDPANPSIVADYVCPASQSDVSVYRNLLFVSGEGLEGRLDCGMQGVQERVSEERLRGIRIFDISDISNPRYVSNVQTCRGSHTHSVLVDPDDDENVYVYVSGSAGVRPAAELPGCVSAPPEEDPESALFRIEVIKIPIAHPERAAIVSSPRIFEDLVEPETHGEVPGENTAGQNREPEPGPTQCHDITLYPAMGLAGGACEGYGMLLDISDPVNPTRIDEVEDPNFAYWHSATFNNDASKIVFTDEWGGGTQPKCRESDPMEWGANAIFEVEGREMDFKSYYKMPAPQTEAENCVAHNGSLIPIPGRDVMAQSWYQGGVSIFDWTDPGNPVEIAFHDRGPLNEDRRMVGGSWSVYWYNGMIVSSEIARGLDIFELVPSPFLTENEIAAANTVHLDYLNAQGQPHLDWPPTFVLARAYLDQIDRSGGLSDDRISTIREELGDAESASGASRRETLTALASELSREASESRDARKVQMLADTVRELASAM